MDCATKSSSGSPDDRPPRTDVVIGIIRRRDRILISRRREGGAFAGLWEFPGGKREKNETLAQALVRELREELALDVRAIEPLPSIDHDYPTMSIRLHPWLCDAGAGEPKPLASQELRWIDPQTLGSFTFPAGNASLQRHVMDRLARDGRRQ